MELNVIHTTANATAKKASAETNARALARPIPTARDVSKFVVVRTEANVITFRASATVLQGLPAHCEC